MSSSLPVCMTELSKQLGDYWASTTTGAGSATTLVDSALMAKANDWVTDNSWAFLTEEPAGDAAIYDERKASSLSNTDGTLTTLTFAAAPGSGIDYELHRLFSPSEKRRALISAARSVYPHIFKEIRDESLVSGNWLKDGSFEIWTDSTTPTYWTVTTVTVTKTSTAGLFKHGSFSAALTGTAGTLSKTISNNEDLKKLAGKSATFTVQAKASAASSARISIYDGTTYTYSDYNDQITGWTKDNEPLTVQATIQDHPSAVTFTIHYVSGTVYVDDARVICGDNGKVYIGNLGLAQNKPHQVLIEPSDYYTGEPWTPIRDITYDTTNGYMYLPNWVSSDYRLRILGIGYLGFLSSAGVVDTGWATASVAIDSPQLDILVAQAILYLYTEMSMPNFETGTRTAYQQMMAYWKAELADREAKFGMRSPGVLVNWGVG